METEEKYALLLLFLAALSLFKGVLY